MDWKAWFSSCHFVYGSVRKEARWLSSPCKWFNSCLSWSIFGKCPRQSNFILNPWKLLSFLFIIQVGFKIYFFKSFNQIYCMCVWVHACIPTRMLADRLTCMCHVMCVGAGGQLEEAGSLISLHGVCGTWRLNSGCQAWWQVPLPAEPSHWLIFIFIY